MITLLDKKLAPIIFRVGFLNCSFSNVQNAFFQWKSQQFKSIEIKQITSDFELALQKLQPLTTNPRRWMLISAGTDWVAYFDNGINGPDPVSVIGYLSNRLACRGVIATSIPNMKSTGQMMNSNSCLYGAVQFELFSPCKTNFLNYERTVSVANDGGRWRFDANGILQTFEESEVYKKRQIVDRFTPEMLVRYCHAMGINVDDPSFYRTPAVLIWSNDLLPIGHFALSLAQVQKQMGLTGEASSTRQP